MYEYRRATPEVRKELLEERQRKSWPWHAPPHFANSEHVYLLTAACFEHQPIMQSEMRRDEWLSSLRVCVAGCCGDLRGWVVLPNHYHLVARVDLAVFAAKIARLHNASRLNGTVRTRRPAGRSGIGFLTDGFAMTGTTLLR